MYIKDAVTMSKIRMVLANKKVKKPTTSQYSQQRLKNQSIDDSRMDLQIPDTYLKRSDISKSPRRTESEFTRFQNDSIGKRGSMALDKPRHDALTP